MMEGKIEMVCKFCGSSNIEVTPRTTTCHRCHMSYETPESSSKPKRGTRRSSSSSAPPPKQTRRRIPITELQDTDSSTYIRIHDTVTHYNENGDVDHVETVQDIDFLMVAKKDVPDLTINANYAEFMKWLHRDLIKKEKRYGRDNLRQRGLVRKAEVEDRGKVVTLWVPKEQAHRSVEELLEEVREKRHI